MPTGDIPVIEHWQDPDDADWLTPIIHEGSAQNWCMRPNCTTCGSHDFRRAVLVESARRARVQLPIDIRRPWDVVRSLAPDARAALYDEQVKALRHLEVRRVDWDAARLLLMELPSLAPGTSSLSMDTLLGDSSASRLLRAMREHERELIERRRQAREALRNVDAIRAAKAAQRQQQHAMRREARHVAARHREEILRMLEPMTVSARLGWLATDVSCTIDALPAGLFLPSVDEARELDADIRQRVLTRIDQRRGEWGRVRRRLQHDQ